MITVASTVGRLIEVRFSGALTPDEMKDMRTPLSQAVVRIAVDVVFVVDFRTCGALSTEVTPMMLGLMRSDNRKILRSAHLFAPGSTILEQMKLSIAEAANPNRRAFQSADALTQWLAEAVTPEEHARTRAFFA